MSTMYVDNIAPLNGSTISTPVIAASRGLTVDSTWTTYTYIPFSEVFYDTALEANGDNTRFTIKYDGVYLINWTALTYLTQANKIALYVDGQYKAQAFSEGATSGVASYTTLSQQIILQLNAGQDIGFNTHNHDGRFYPQQHTIFNIFRLG